MTAKNAKELEELHQLQKEDAIERQRNGLLNFSAATFPGGTFEINWHHRALCRVLNAFARGQIRRLIITLPPRHSKSQLVSRNLPAFLLGRHPGCKIIGASYSDSLAASMNRDVQRIIESPSYAQIFPGTRLRSTGGGTSGWTKTKSYFETVKAGGYYRSAGIGGSITGFGADVALLDDYCRNRDDADSQTLRDSAWDWFGSTFMTRLEKDGAVCITATRWHEDDLIGRLLTLAAKDPEADQWYVVNLPALAESDPTDIDPRAMGEALWPTKYTAEYLARTRVTIGSRNFSALYQQRPAPDSGMIVQKSWWKYYIVPPPNFDKVIQSWDLTFVKSATSDYVVGVVLGKVGADVYLLDMIRDRLSFTGTLEAFRKFTEKWPDAHAKYVEQAANGAALIDVLRTELSGIIAVPPHGTKIARANAVSPRIEAGNVWLPDPSVFPWVNQVISEWTTFPAGTNDDIVDAMTQGLARLPTTKVDDFLPMGIGTGNTYFPRAN